MEIIWRTLGIARVGLEKWTRRAKATIH